MLLTFDNKVLLHQGGKLGIISRLELLATESVLRPLNVKDMAGVLHSDDVAVADTLEAVAGSDHGFFDAHRGKNCMK